ncbi:MAG TPA: UDP-N-acetylmuramoyl-L-alanine--D-glutamate ligase [Spirochaetales bacterium]|nr:UDP-N-acetylmuramoyl-L-alanine--D-glutamate ligase [Spirochaetales bacterium]
MKKSLDAIRGMKVTVMGLGLNGGGLEAARFFARQGAQVTVTDLRSKEVLRPSLEQLSGLPIRYVLGRHDLSDFQEADLVVKNPAVRPDSPFLKAARNVETDLSIFLSFFSGPLLAVTGSKGKSTIVSALYYGLQKIFPQSRLGGNITISPLSFLDEIDNSTPVVLELSSFQLGDLPDPTILKPRIAIITSIFPDHQDRYPDMETYVNDKRIIYRSQKEKDSSIFHYDDPFGKRFLMETPATPYAVSSSPLPKDVQGAFLEENKGWIVTGNRKELIVPEQVSVIGPHQRKNLLFAGLALRLFGLPSELVQESMAAFPGVEHRLEFCGEAKGVRFYNDSAATVPEALVCGVESFSQPVLLITGGTDKNLDFTPFRRVAEKPKAIYLIEGTATRKLKEILEAAGIRYKGPYDALETAVQEAFQNSNPGDVILFSPGCTSFGMFLNEFDRGRKYKALVATLLNQDPS